MEDADYAIVGMGSMIDTAEATVDWIRDEFGHQGRHRSCDQFSAVPQRGDRGSITRGKGVQRPGTYGQSYGPIESVDP